MVLATSYETRGSQDIPDINPILNQYGYQGRAATFIIDDGSMAEDRMFFFTDRNLAAPTNNRQVEGFTYSDLDTALQVGTRRTQFTQILSHVALVTDSAAVQKVVGGPLMMDQIKLKQLFYLNDLEYVTLNATGGSGASAVSQGTFGLFDWSRTNGTTTAGLRSWTTTGSGVSADTNTLRAMQLRSHKLGNNISDFIVDDVIKARVSTSSSTAAPVYRVQDDQTIMQSIDMFKADVGPSRLHLSHYVEYEGGPAGTVGLFGINSSLGHLILGLDRSNIERAWYRPTHRVTVAKTASSERTAIEGEFGHRVWSPSAIQVAWNVY